MLVCDQLGSTPATHYIQRVPAPSDCWGIFFFSFFKFSLKRNCQQLVSQQSLLARAALHLVTSKKDLNIRFKALGQNFFWKSKCWKQEYNVACGGLKLLGITKSIFSKKKIPGKNNWNQEPRTLWFSCAHWWHGTSMTEKCYVWWNLKLVITHCSFSKVGILFGIFLITTGQEGPGCSPRNQTLFSCKLVSLFSYARKQRPERVTQVFEGLFVGTTFKIL